MECGASPFWDTLSQAFSGYSLLRRLTESSLSQVGASGVMKVVHPVRIYLV